MGSRDKRVILIAVGVSSLVLVVAIAALALLAMVGGEAATSGDDRLFNSLELYEADDVAGLDDADLLASQLEIDWPSSARDLQVAADGFQDPFYHARFTIDVGQLDALVASSLCTELAPGTDDSVYVLPPNEKVDWWEPDTIAEPATCSGDGPAVRSVIIADTWSPTEVEVYVLTLHS